MDDSNSQFPISSNDIIDYPFKLSDYWQEYEDRNEEIELAIKLIEDLKNTAYDDPGETGKSEVIQSLEDKLEKLQCEKSNFLFSTKAARNIAWQIFFRNLHVWERYFYKLKPTKFRLPQKFHSKTLAKLNRYGAKTASLAYLATSVYDLYFAHRDDSEFRKKNEEAIQQLKDCIDVLQNTDFDDEEDQKSAQELMANFEDYLVKLSNSPKHRQVVTALARIFGGTFAELAAFSFLGPVGLPVGLLASAVTGSTIAEKVADYCYEKNQLGDVDEALRQPK